MTLEINPLDAALGAQVRGVHLDSKVPAADFDLIAEALINHHVLVFPEQDISEAEQVGFSRKFGELEIHPSETHRSSIQPEIYRVANVGEDGRIFPVKSYDARYLTGTRIWHTDSSFRSIPSLGSILRAVEVPPAGGETLFCNLHTVYENLPPELKDITDRHTAIHSYDYIQTLVFGDQAKDFSQQDDLVQQHPLTRSHPVTARRSLYISPHTISQVVGLDEADSRAFLDEVYGFASQDQFVYRHIWTQNDVVMWDNRCTMHAVTPYDSARHRRVLLRTTVAGDGPVAR